MSDISDRTEDTTSIVPAKLRLGASSTKLRFRVSGARAGDAVRPVESEKISLVLTRPPIAPRPAAPLTADDYASAEDYE